MKRRMNKTNEKSVFWQLNRDIKLFSLNKFASNLIVLLLLLVAYAPAQDRNPARGYQAGNSYSISDIENVNLTNGNLILNIPLASLPSGRGTSAGYTVSLRYNSKLWNSKQERRRDGNPDENGSTDYMRELLVKSDSGGWKLDDGSYLLEVIGKFNLEEPAPCVNGGGYEYRRNAYTIKLEMQFPDGRVKEFRPYGNGLPYQDPYGEGYFSIDPNGLQRVVTHATRSGGSNSIASCDETVYQETTAGMHYYTNDGSGIRLFIPHNEYRGAGIFTGRWTMYFPDGKIVENKPIDDSSVWQRITDRNGNKLFRKPGTLKGIDGVKIENDVGQFIFFAGNKIIQQGFNGELVETTVQWKDYWVSRRYKATLAFNAQEQGRYADVFESFYALEKIILPSQTGNLEYNFTYNASSTRPEPGNYTSGWGELKSVTLPSGAKADYLYSLDEYSANSSESDSFSVLYNSVKQRELTYLKDYDGHSEKTTEKTLYGTDAVVAGVGSVTMPNGATTSEVSDRLGNFKGYSYRTYNQNGSITEKIWNHNAAPKVGGSNSQAINAYVKTEFTSISDEGGNPVLTAIKDFDYDKNGNILEIREYDWVAYEVVPRSGSGIFTKPTGLPTNGLALKRKTVNEFYNPTPIATDSTTDSPNHYANPNSPKLKNVIKSSEIRDGNNNIVFRSEFFYDDPTNKGNLIETRTWDSTKGAITYPLTQNNAIITKTEYNQYGAPELITDAKGNKTQITYGPINTPNGEVSGLYPTQTITAYGTSVKRTSTAVYDFYTGLVTSAIDTDNDVTSRTEYDGLGRPIKVKAAVESDSETWTQTEYDDRNRRVITRSDLEEKGDGKKVSVQHYDQLGRIRLSRTIENSATEDPGNEQHGLKVQTRYQYDKPSDPENSNGVYTLTSNPYRAAISTAATNERTMGWNVSYTTKTGKHSKATSFSGAALPAPWGRNSVSVGIVTTDIDTDKILRTDQAGKRRISRTNVLGHLTDVWEITEQDSQTSPINFANQPGITHGYHTSYSYDALGNLRMVNQGGQKRFFAYDSLNRLRRAKNPEQNSLTPDSFFPTLLDDTSGESNDQWSVAYSYDNNGNLDRRKDARNVTTKYEYDELNRNYRISYEGESGIRTPDIDLLYDTALRGKGRLSEMVTKGVSATSIDEYDELGRVKIQRQNFWVNNAWGASYQIKSKYDLAGNVRTLTYPSEHEISYSYDSSGRLSDADGEPAFKGNLGDGQIRTYSSAILYDAFGGRNQERYGTDIPVYNKNFYNERGQLAEIRVGTTAFPDSGWNRGAILNVYSDAPVNGWTSSGADNNGNLRKQMTYIPHGEDPSVSGSTNFVQYYGYDQLNRLKSVEDKENNSIVNFRQTFDYDRWGNRTINAALTSDNVNKKQFRIDPTNNRLNVPQNQSGAMSYDGAGNLTFDSYTGSGARTYDAENRMTTAQISADQSASYVYDGAGKRIKRNTATGEGEIWQVYGMGGELIAEYAANASPASPQKEYGYRGGELLISAPASSGSDSEPLLTSTGKIKPTTVTASSTYSTNVAANVTDGNVSTSWLAGGFPAQWIQQDLGKSYDLQKIRLNVQQNPAGSTVHEIYGGATANDLRLLGTLSGNTQVGQWLEFVTTATNIRFVQVKTTSGPSWVAWNEIEVYGSPTLKITPSAVTASSTYSNAVSANAADGNTATNWVSNGYPAQWIQQDLGKSYDLRKVRLNVVQSPAGFTSHEIYGGETPTSLRLLGTLSGNTQNGQWLELTKAAANIRYVQVKTTSSPSWVAWSEIEVYGTPTPQKIAPSSVTASNSHSTMVPSNAADGNLNTYWNAGGYPVQWIQQNLGKSYDLQKIRLNVLQSPAGNTVHEVYGGATTSDLKLLGTLNGNTQSGQWLELTTTATNIRYVRVKTTSSPSWVGWYEFEVYGSSTNTPLTNPGISWLITDQLGTPRMVIDKTGSLRGVTRHDYLPFGEELITGVGGRTTEKGYSDLDVMRQKFTSYERDTETNLDYAQARYYANVQGRFTSVDPLLASASLTNPQSWNRYAYVLNNPMRFTDPTGMVPQDSIKRNEPPPHPVQTPAPATVVKEELNKRYEAVSTTGEVIGIIQAPQGSFSLLIGVINVNYSNGFMTGTNQLNDACYGVAATTSVTSTNGATGTTGKASEQSQGGELSLSPAPIKGNMQTKDSTNSSDARTGSTAVTEVVGRNNTAVNGATQATTIFNNAVYSMTGKTVTVIGSGGGTSQGNLVQSGADAIVRKVAVSSYEKGIADAYKSYPYYMCPNK